MHTDEYEISISRELDVCEKQIGAIRRSLSAMEKKYDMKTENFVKAFQSGEMKDQKGDFISWIRHYEDINRWGDRKRQYENLFRVMKI
jgi:hypothetical protein